MPKVLPDGRSPTFPGPSCGGGPDDPRVLWLGGDTRKFGGGIVIWEGFLSGIRESAPKVKLNRWRAEGKRLNLINYNDRRVSRRSTCKATL